MFLKRIELQGFKSFADKTIIHFNEAMTGIVGPNGCGKSNINDAIRWVLGEQSIKSLRGNSMSDVIFSGSTTKKSVNIAKVSLIFDNAKRYFPIEFDEVEITRCLHRINNENEYFINKTPVRLKDILNLIMDSGLGKDSLSIISQGNISAFAEAKPIERRAIFEEAASVSKYKKRKIESLNKLERTNENLIRIQDIINELEKQLVPLEKQKEKALLYLSKEKKLKEIEITVIVDNIIQLEKQQQEEKNHLNSYAIEVNLLTTQLEEKETYINSTRKTMYQFDFEINQLQENLVSHLNKIKELESHKIEIEEKRKYQKNSEDNLIRKQLLFEELSEATYEYENRNQRLNELNTNLNFNKNEFDSLTAQLNVIEDEIRKQSSYLANIKNNIEVNQKLIQQPFLSQQGVKNILEAKQLVGILGTINTIFTPKETYEKAISAALNSIMYHIVVTDADAGTQAINYLKKNNAGRATFIPINLLKPHFLSKETTLIAESVAGYLGVASDFVSCTDKFMIAKQSFLGNILICTNIENANELAKRIKHQYKIITLDGDVIHRGGSMSGGSAKNNQSLFLLKKEKENLEEKKLKLETTLQNFIDEKNKLLLEKQNLDSQQLKIRLDIAKLTTVVENIRNKKERLEYEFNQIEVSGEVNLTFDDEFIKQLSDAYQKQDELTSQIKTKRTLRLDMGNKLEQEEIYVRTIRREITQQQNAKQQSELALVRIDTQLEHELNTLRNTYAMTFEHAQTLVIDIDIDSARNEVYQLKNDIIKLGNVNLDAPDLFVEVDERYQHLSKQSLELQEAKTDILNAIDEMDDMVKKQFKQTFDAINEQLNIVFQSLFPKGHASLVLVEPDDLLNTGIDVQVSFPGKTLKNIRLFSGGEKALVAICVLFAIIKARTMPLCIFDEVEAALDQINVDKFANYIATLKEDTQFIVVTHRPGTMVKCDQLFGVTMQQSGVSTILSIKMEEAISLINN